MVHPPCQCPCWKACAAPGAKAVVKPFPTRNSDASILAQAPPPLTKMSDLSHTVKPSRPRTVPSQRSFVEDTQNGWAMGRMVPSDGSNAWPSLLVLDQSPSMPKTHQPT